jgi:hypothetical protein
MNMLIESIIDPESTPTIGALHADTLILDSDGRLISIEDLVYEPDAKIEVIALDKHLRITTTKAHSFCIGEWADEVYTITLDNGQLLKTVGSQKVMCADGEWVAAKDLHSGSVISTVTYDFRQKHLIKNCSSVESVEQRTLESKEPLYSFNVDKQDNLLVGFLGKDDVINLIVAHQGESSLAF